MNTLSAPTSKPWYREPWPWFLISLPATAVIAGVATVWIATTSADGLVVGDYYKAGLAINQTLARDDAAHALALTATLQHDNGILALTLEGRLQAYPDRLNLMLAHPTRQGQDQMLVFSHAGGGHYRTSLPAMPAGKWHALLSDAAATWRLSGVLHTPFSLPVTLTTDAESTVQSEGY
ncbi:MAG: FixH family protein [Thiobacillus sp.]|nr:FixH family protein [Thiobacillus sp.]MDP2980012.1 FixH family protein [Thiobacillus sp.]